MTTNKEENSKKTPLREPLEIDLRDGNVLEFQFVEDFASWVSEEQTTWEKQREKITTLGAVATAGFAKQAANLEAIVNNIPLLLNTASEQDHERGWNRAQKHLNLINSGLMVCSKSQRGKLIWSFLESDPATAAGILAHSVGQGYDPGGSTRVSDLAPEIDVLTKGTIALQVPEVQRLRVELSETQQAWRDSMQNLRSDLREKIETAQQEIRAAEALGEKFFRKVVNQKIEHSKRMQTIEDTFTTKIALEASEKYWGKVQDEKRDAALKAGWFFTALVVLGIPVLIAYFGYVPQKFPGVPWDEWQTQLFFFGLPVFGLVWAIRLVSMRYMANTEIADDARTRVAMLSAFVALEKEEKVSAEERLVILEALFRPRSAIAGGDTVPHPMMAIAYRILHQRSGGSTDS